MNIQIKHLMDCPEQTHLIASWIYNEWWTEKPEMNLTQMEDLLKLATNKSDIPLTLVAFVDEKPVGTVSLIESDNLEFPKLKPWLAALFVHPDFRKKGIGSALYKECRRCAKSLTIPKFYLGTDIPNFYKALGAELFTTGSKNLKILKVTV